MTTNIEVPSVKDIHRIAYLTMHGWELNYRDKWEKPGVLRELSDDEKRDNRRMANRHRAEDWELEAAYYWQQEESNPSEKKASV